MASWCTVEDDDQPKPLDNEARVLLFRAVRELLFNVLKHAQASCARVRMLRNGEHLRVIVEDDGVGFAPGQTRGLVRENGRFRTLQHPGAPELFRWPHGDRVNLRGGHPDYPELTFAARQEKKALPHGDPAPRQGNRPAGGAGSGAYRRQNLIPPLPRQSVSLSRPARPEAAAVGLKPAPGFLPRQHNRSAPPVRIPPATRIGKGPTLPCLPHPGRNSILELSQNLVS